MEDLIRKGVEHLHNGEMEKAESLFAFALAQDESVPDLWHTAGLCAWMEDDFDLAQYRFRRAIALDDQVACYHNNYGNALQGLQEFEQSVEAYNRALALDPDYAQAWTNLGVAKHELKRLDEALEAHQKAIAISASHSGAQYNIGRTYMEMERHLEAKQHLEIALKLTPDDPNVLNNLGSALSALSDHEGARFCYAKAIALAPSQIDTICNMGLSYIEAGDLDQALMRMDAALKINPDHRESNLRAGWLYNQKTLPNIAENCYRRLLQIDPEDVEAWIGLGDSLNLQGRKQDAASAYRRALSKSPNHSIAWVQLGNTLFEMGLIEEAKEAQNQLQKTPKTPTDNWISEGLKREARGEFKSASKAFKNALKLDPSNGTAQHLLAVIEGKTPEKAPADYVKQLFNAYSDRFDDHLQNELMYQTPTELLHLLESNAGKRQWNRCIDLGCGTGLMGELIADSVQTLIGIDLSNMMLIEAKKKKIYTELIESDVEQALYNLEPADLILAADVLVYIGNLAPLMKIISQRLMPDGRFVCSVELTESGYHLNSQGRFSHSVATIEENCFAAGLSILQKRDVQLRQEGKKWVLGMAFVIAPQGAQPHLDAK